MLALPCCLGGSGRNAGRGAGGASAPGLGVGKPASGVYRHCPGGSGKHGGHRRRHPQRGGRACSLGGGGGGGDERPCRGAPQKYARKPPVASCRPRTWRAERAARRSEALAGRAAPAEVAGSRGGGGGILVHASAISPWGGGGPWIPPGMFPPNRRRGRHAGASGAAGGVPPVSLAGRCTVGWPGAPPRQRL